MTFFGSGDAIIETLNPIASIGETKMQDLCFLNLATASQPTEVKSQCRNRKTGFLETKRKGVTEIVHTITITANHYDWQALGFFHNEIPQAVASNLNVNKVVQIPSGLTAPFEITDPDIVAANADSVRGYITEKGVWGDARSLKRTADSTTAPSDGTEIQIDDANSKIVVHQSLGGAYILYKLDEPYLAIQTIGVASTWEAFGDIEMFATLYGTEDFAEGIQVHFPTLIRTPAPPVLDLTQSPATVTITFEGNSVDGRPFPYRLLNPEYAVAA